ncbi:MAG: hypothetical protein IME98_03780 [Proteobacteria bacterium]|nr:hypothetical protein [Pseudomonadota bacterium]
MTELYIDDNKIEYEDTDNNSTVGDFIREVEKELFDVKQLIIGVEVDGDPAEDIYARELLDSPVAEHKEVRLSTAPLKVLLDEGIKVCNQYIPHIKGAIGVIIETLRAGKNDESFSLMPGLFDALNEFVRTLAVINSNVVRFNLPLFKEPPTETYEGLVAHLGEMLTARDSGDLILVGDLLEYEITPIIIKLEKLLLESEMDF